MLHNYNARNWYGGRTDVPDLRRELYSGDMGLVEHYGVSSANALQSSYSPDYQFAIPVFGAMQWRIASNVSFVDQNTGLFVRAGEEFSEIPPIEGIGHTGLIVTPSAAFLDEVCASRKRLLPDVFRSDTRPASIQAQLCAHLIVCQGMTMPRLAIEELSIIFVEELLAADEPRSPSATRRMIDRVKEMLHSLDCEPVTLTEIAKEVGVSPVYLTQAFKKWEGVPLYRYQSRLRLNRALAELPFTESLTDLALSLGYSSHSHFTAAFRDAFGITPSEFRRSARSGRGDDGGQIMGLVSQVPQSRAALHA